MSTEPPAFAFPPPPASDGSRPRRARSGPPWSLVVVALGLAVVSLAVAVAVLLVRPAGSDTEAARRSALEAARERTLALTSYDYRQLEENFAGVLATATGQFATDYQETTAQLRPTFTDAQAVASATVVAAGLESFAPDRAVAVIAVDQVIATKDAPPRTERNRLRMTLVRPADTWLVERVERL